MCGSPQMEKQDKIHPEERKSRVSLARRIKQYGTYLVRTAI